MWPVGWASAHHGDAKVSMFDAQLARHDDGGKGESAAHVDGAVVEGHGCGLALGEELGDEAKADRVLGGLRCCKAHSGCQQLPKAVHLHSHPPWNMARGTLHTG